MSTQYIDDSMLIISQLINNKNYFKRIISHLQPEYFDFDLDKRIFKFIQNYSAKYDSAPGNQILKNALSKLDLVDPEHEQYINEFLELVDEGHIVDMEPMCDKTELYIKEQALKNAINQTIQIYKGESPVKKEGIPDLIKTALAVSIEESSGEFYFDLEAAQKRREEYNNPISKIPFKIQKMNDITNGGIGKKGLHLLAAAPNVGKSATMIALASDYVEQGYNVLYVSCEMSEAQIGIRFDAHFLNYETQEIPKLDEELYYGKLKKLKEKYGKLIIKEYPTNELTALKLETYLDELATKTDFKPDLVFIDYIGICSSYKVKDLNNIGIYYTKVAEEFRAAAQKKDFALWTAQQLTTDALDNMDPTLKHLALGAGLGRVSDLCWFVLRNEEMDKVGQLLIKQEKTRYHKERIVRFSVGFDIGHMKIYEAENAVIPLEVGVLGSGGKMNNTPAINKPKINSAFNNMNNKTKNQIKI